MTTLSMEVPSKAYWDEIIAQLSSEFAQRAAMYDQTNTFISENYKQLKAHLFFQ